MLDFKNMKDEGSRPTQLELNSFNQNRTAKENVEIFSSMVRGKDVSKYGKRVDAINSYVVGIAKKANDGDEKAQAEINAIRTIMIQAPLTERLNLLNMMGEVIRVGKDEEVKFKVFELQGEKSREQANNATFPFVTQKYRTETMTDFKTITGGTLVDYREIASGNLDAEAVMIEQVQTDMLNQMWYYVYNALYTGVKNATSLKNFSEASGISKATLDSALLKARRWSNTGQVTIAGDFSVVSQLNNFAGFATDATTGLLSDVRYSNAVMDEIMSTGLLSRYFKNPVVEIPNTYNLTQLNSAKDFFETYMPEGLMFLLPNGATSPLKIGVRGGIETMVGQDINTRSRVQRFDLEFGTHLVKEHVPQIGLISDEDFAVDKRN